MSQNNDPGIFRVILVAACPGLATYILTQLSLHGVNFELVGVQSEAVKAGIVTTLTGCVMMPMALVYKIRDSILWLGNARKIICDAVHGKKTEGE